MLSNLVSGLLGALFVLLLDKVIVFYKNKSDAKKLCSIFVNDLLAIIRLGELNDQNIANTMQKSLLSANLWRNLTPEMLRVLPIDLLQKIVYIYTSFELLSKPDNINREHELYIKIKNDAEAIAILLSKYAGIYDSKIPS